MEGSESSFRWATYDAVQAWLGSMPSAFTFQAFPDDLESVVEPDAICAIVIGLVHTGVFLGYQGIENFWGGAMSESEMTRILDEIAHLRILADEMKDETQAVE